MALVVRPQASLPRPSIGTRVGVHDAEQRRAVRVRLRASSRRGLLPALFALALGTALIASSLAVSGAGVEAEPPALNRTVEALQRFEDLSPPSFVPVQPNR